MRRHLDDVFDFSSFRCIFSAENRQMNQKTKEMEKSLPFLPDIW
jgi:hypothetical protein